MSSSDIELDAREWLVLAGLVRVMMHADGKISVREHGLVGRLATRLGPALWTNLALAEIRLPDEAAVRSAAARVERPAARALIRAVAEEVAWADGIDDSERALLDWLDALWRV